MTVSNHPAKNNVSTPSLLQIPAVAKSTPPSKKLAMGIIFGLVGLQLITLILVLSVVFFGTPSPEEANTESAFNVSTIGKLSQTLTQPAPPTPISIESNKTLQPVNSKQGAIDEPAPPAQPLVLQLRGMEITQGIQVFNEPESFRCNPNPDHTNNIFCNNSMPMVAGRHTLVRVYLACNGPCPTTDITVQLRLLKNGQEKLVVNKQVSPQRLQQISNVNMQTVRSTLENSVNFEFFPPPAWLADDVTFELHATPQVESEMLPVTASITKNFAVRKPLRVAYLPIRFNDVEPANPADVDYWLLRMYPVSSVDYYRLPVPDMVWDGDVTKSEILRKLLYNYTFFTQYSTKNTAPDQLFGWLPQEFYNGGVSDPFWCPNCAGPHSSRVAFGGLRPEQDIGGPRILAHEIAHNLGAQHAWSPTYNEDEACFRAEGADIRVDPDWPYMETPYIQEVGIDLYSSPPVVYAPNNYDMMAYCAHPWISPHTYKKIFESPLLDPNSKVVAAFQPPQNGITGDALLVSGLIYPDGTVPQPEVSQLSVSSTTGFTPPPGNDYCLSVHGTDNKLLAHHCFEVGFINLETGLPTDPSPYFFTLPGVNPEAVGNISISKNKKVVVSMSPSSTAPEVTVTFPNGSEVLSGKQTIIWQGQDADGDSLLYDLLYSTDGGQQWLPLATRLAETSYTVDTAQIPPGDSLKIRVVANDGFHTTVDNSDGNFVVRP